MKRGLRFVVLPSLIALSCESSSTHDTTVSVSGTGGRAVTAPPASSGTGGVSAATGGSTAAGGKPESGGAPQSAGNGGKTSAEGGSTASGGSVASAGEGGTPKPGGTGGTTSGGGAGGSAGSTTIAWKEQFPRFERHEVAKFSDGYYTAAFDVDGDELPDIAALSASRSELVWFKNPSWDRYTISTGTTGYICMAPYDIDADGDLDLAIGSEFSLTNTKSGGTVYWAEAPDDPTMDEEWALHSIDEVPTTHRLRFGDLDGDGRKELLNLPIFGIGSTDPEHVGAVQLKAYQIPSNPAGAWSARIVDDTLLEVAHALSVVDWDGDEKEDLLTASNAGVYLFRPGLGEMPRQLGAGKDGARPNRGSSEANLGSLGGKRFIATIEPWHGTDAVVYTEGVAEADPWVRSVIGQEFERGHALATADFNADGYDEILAGDQNGGGALMIFRYLPDSEKWERIDVDTGTVNVIGVDIADFNGDGALDIVAVGGSSNNLVWYENSR